MADEQYTWLDRATADRLLRGESLDAVDAAARDQAERLSRALGALSAEAAPATAELPGEQAALAAFRKAREAADAERTAAAHAPSVTRAPGPGADAGLIRIGAPPRTGIPARRRPRWARPVRLALAAALAAGMLGGVAVAASSGVLPTPFGDEHPRPGASVSADSTTGDPLASPPPSAAPGSGTGTGTPDGATRGSPGGTPPGEAAGTDDGTGRDTAPGSAPPSATSGTGWLGAAATCRALRDGKDLDPGRRRGLEHLAGGAARLAAYCKVLLASGDSTSGTAHGGTPGKGKGGKDGEGSGKDGKGKGGEDKDKDGGGGKGGDGGRGGGHDHPGGGHGRGDGRDGRGGGHDGRRHGGALPVLPSASAAHHDRTGGDRTLPLPSASPSYTAL
ncbi:hypothetical protein ACF073_02540 [Streptomyces sp. NPDC015171]|uniref:hypothetical protein n=1 Tax=Streptomyces sp. NPDC015171 TaxID=3364945 RepID=UPI0036FD8523